jgi:hypothetical protein
MILIISNFLIFQIYVQKKLKPLELILKKQRFIHFYLEFQVVLWFHTIIIL